GFGGVALGGPAHALQYLAMSAGGMAPLPVADGAAAQLGAADVHGEAGVMAVQFLRQQRRPAKQAALVRIVAQGQQAHPGIGQLEGWQGIITETAESALSL